MTNNSLVSMTSLEKNKPYIAMIFVQFSYAGMALFSKAAIAKGMNPYVFVAYRQAFATIALAPFACFLERKNAGALSRYLMLKICLVSLVGIALSLNLYAYAIKYISATFASASINTVPVLTFVITVVFRMESITVTNVYGVAKILGSVVSLSGAMVFAFVKGPQVNFMNWSATSSKEIPSISYSTKEWIQGSLLMLSANIAWASWLVMQAPLVKQYPAKLRLTTLQCLFSCIQSSIWAMAMERNITSWKLAWDLNLLSVAYCGVIVTGLTYRLQLSAVEKKGPLFTATFTPLSLIITIIFSSLLWKEMLHLGSICGGILLVGGLYGVLWGKNHESKDQANDKKPDSNRKTLSNV